MPWPVSKLEATERIFTTMYASFSHVKIDKPSSQENENISTELLFKGCCIQSITYQEHQVR